MDDHGSGARIRTSIHGSKVRGPTVRRHPNESAHPEQVLLDEGGGAILRASCNLSTWRPQRDSNPPSSARQADMLNHYTMGPKGRGLLITRTSPDTPGTTDADDKRIVPRGSAAPTIPPARRRSPSPSAGRPYSLRVDAAEMVPHLMVGRVRLELTTFALSERRSNHSSCLPMLTLYARWLFPRNQW